MIQAPSNAHAKGNKKGLEIGGQQAYAESPRQKRSQPHIYICSEHPLAVETIKKALSSIRGVRPLIQSFPGFPLPQDNNNRPVLVLDTVSIREWQEILVRWKSNGGQVIVLASPNSGANDNMRGIYLGANATVKMSANLGEELPKAIRVAATQGMWISPESLTEYVNAANSLLRQMSSPTHRLTHREAEVLTLLIGGDSNKEIGNTLGISERTAKFHVSRILRKAAIKNRRELIRKIRGGTLTYLDVISHRGSAETPFLVPRKSA